MIVEALYNAIGESTRRRFHQQIADVIEARFVHLVDAQPEVLAEHFTAAGLLEKAIGFCLKAGLRSRDRFAHAEAINHLTKGLKLLEALEPTSERDTSELEFLGALGTAYIAHAVMPRRRSDRFLVAHAYSASVSAKADSSQRCGAIRYHIVRRLSDCGNWPTKPCSLPSASTIRAS